MVLKCMNLHERSLWPIYFKPSCSWPLTTMAISRPLTSSIVPELVLSFKFSDVSFHFDPSFPLFPNCCHWSHESLSLLLLQTVFSYSERFDRVRVRVHWFFDDIFVQIGWLGLMNCWFCWLILMKRCGFVCSWCRGLWWRCFGWEGAQVCIPSRWAALHSGFLLASSLLVHAPLIWV